MTEETKNIFMEAQKGELDAVIMYNMLADAMESENREIAENLRKIAKDEGKHAAIFKKLTGEAVVPDDAQAKYVCGLLPAIGTKTLFANMAKGEYDSIEKLKVLQDEYPELRVIVEDEPKHGDALIKMSEITG